MDEKTYLTSDEWARWALLGNDTANVPPTFTELHSRIAGAIRRAIKDDQERREKVDSTNTAVELLA